jgi:thiamine biosynthesis lipoprotein ApbE
MIHLIEFRAMGCQVSVQLEADERGADVLRNLPQRFATIEATLTRFDPNSELMRLNARAGE